MPEFDADDENAPITLDEFHWHEALDRTHLVLEMFSNHVASHPAITQTPAPKALADEIEEKLASLYQRIPNEEARAASDEP